MALNVTIGRMRLVMEADAKQLRREVKDTREDVRQDVRKMKTEIRDEIDSDGGLMGVGRGDFIGAGIDVREVVGDIVGVLRGQFMEGLEDAREMAADLAEGRSGAGIFTAEHASNVREFSAALEGIVTQFKELRAAVVAASLPELLGFLQNALAIFDRDKSILAPLIDMASLAYATSRPALDMVSGGRFSLRTDVLAGDASRAATRAERERFGGQSGITPMSQFDSESRRLAIQSAVSRRLTADNTARTAAALERIERNMGQQGGSRRGLQPAGLQ